MIDCESNKKIDSSILEHVDSNEPASQMQKGELRSGVIGKYVYRVAKRLLDIILSMLGLLVLWPFFLVIACLIKHEDHGPVFYMHKRVGLNGRKISVYKFRSMRMGSESLDGLTPKQVEEYRREFKISDDPRVTKVGSILRQTFLDEMPQILNILRGEMSFVGPRPIMKEELLRCYSEQQQDLLLSCKPGLTGYWQVQERENCTYANGKRQQAELYYIEHESLWLDLLILLKTMTVVFGRNGH